MSTQPRKPHIWKRRFSDLLPTAPKWLCAIDQCDAMKGRGRTPAAAYVDFQFLSWLQQPQQAQSFDSTPLRTHWRNWCEMEKFWDGDRK